MQTLEAPYYDFVFLFAGRSFSSKFIKSWSETIIYLLQNNYSFLYNFQYTPIVTETRNLLLTASPLTIKPSYKNRHKTDLFDNNLKCKKVIFIDDDMVWSVEDIHKLLHSEHQVINGIYMLTGNDFISILDEKNRLLTKDYLDTKTEPFEVLSAGLGFTAIDFQVLQTLQFPFFNTFIEVREIDGIKTALPIGEDFYFFSQIRSKGYKIMADPNIKLKHEKITVLTI